MSKSRQAMGVFLMVLLALTVTLSAVAARYAWRSACGLSDAEPTLDLLVHKAADAFARDGKLCASSRVRLTVRDPDEPSSLSPDRSAPAADAKNAGDPVGFARLGVASHWRDYGEDGYMYQATNDTFVVQAFRVYLYDPEGKLPRWERRGRVVDGHVEIDPRVYEREPGGPEFPGHPAEWNVNVEME